MPYYIIATLFGVIFFTYHPHVASPNTIDWYALGQKVIAEGVIIDEPDRRPLQTKYTIAIDRLIDDDTAQEGITGRVLMTDHRQFPIYEYGDRVRISGTLERPERIETFRYDNYLSRYDIYTVMYQGSIGAAPTPNSLPPTPFVRIKKSLYRFKETFEQQINRLYPEPHASFMAGLLTGSRKGIPDDLMEAFNATGLTHIIAISGYNITIVITIIGSALFWLPFKVRFFPVVGSIVMFTIFVGASAAVVRAAIMGILGLLALQLGRQSHMRLTLLWTALLMCAWNPKILLYDAGFQLSFLAVIGLIELGPFLERFCKWLPTTLAIRESVQMTMSAQLAAVPLIIVLFDRFSLIAPVTNLLVAPLLPLAMLFGALSTTVSFVSFSLGQLLAYFGWVCLEWIVVVAKIGAHIPYASINLHMSTVVIIPYYLFLLFTIHKAKHPSLRKSTEPACS